MFWLSYECFSILCDAFLLKSAISSHNSCEKLVLKVRDMAQVIKKYIYFSGAKSNDPLHFIYIPNVFKFTKISAKGTQ